MLLLNQILKCGLLFLRPCCKICPALQAHFDYISAVRILFFVLRCKTTGIFLSKLQCIFLTGTFCMLPFLSILQFRFSFFITSYICYIYTIFSVALWLDYKVFCDWLYMFLIRFLMILFQYFCEFIIAFVLKILDIDI